jgi:deoxyribodipyrimidine photo-lyase
MTTLLWFRQDLRLHDQAALLAAAAEGPVLPCYVLDDATPGEWAIGGAQRWWLHHSLSALDADLQRAGSRLILRRGHSADVLAGLVQETGATRVHAIRHAEPWWVEAEQALAERVELVLHGGGHLAPLESVRTGSGAPFRIYTPFFRALSQRGDPPQPSAAPKTVSAPDRWPASDALADWQLLPHAPDWAAAFGSDWQPGEAGALARLEAFGTRAHAYHHARNLPSEEGSSRLSPHLHFGEISPATVWHATHASETFARELAWRDFTANRVLDDPAIGVRNGRPALDRIAWRSGKEGAADLRAWQRGRTGYPIVDAGMRQLWTTGWMHNRVRMITASFLIKHLLIDWREGERWFWDTLIDADYGNNAVNWQWVAGTGADSAPFARIMAPLVQSAKFDAAGYIRRWVPELASLSDDLIHDPHEHGVAPQGYPDPLIGHREGRERALAALAESRG